MHVGISRMLRMWWTNVFPVFNLLKESSITRRRWSIYILYDSTTMHRLLLAHTPMASMSTWVATTSTYEYHLGHSGASCRAERNATPAAAWSISPILVGTAGQWCMQQIHFFRLWKIPILVVHMPDDYGQQVGTHYAGCKTKQWSKLQNKTASWT